MNQTKIRQQCRDLQAQRTVFDRKIKELQMLDDMHNCQRIRFSVLKSSGAWSGDLEIWSPSEFKKLKALIIRILGAEK